MLLQSLILTFHRRADHVCKKVYFSPVLCLVQAPGMLLMSMAAATPGCLHRLIVPIMLLGVPAYLTRQHLPHMAMMTGCELAASADARRAGRQQAGRLVALRCPA